MRAASFSLRTTDRRRGTAGGSCGDIDCISFSSSIEGRDFGGRSCSGLTVAWNGSRSCGGGGVVAAQVLRLSLLPSRPADRGRGGRRWQHNSRLSSSSFLLSLSRRRRQWGRWLESSNGRRHTWFLCPAFSDSRDRTAVAGSGDGVGPELRQPTMVLEHGRTT
ncbi:uncharacterized protein LOC115999432 [Ipomoea triloba]|uniref:uncharacterized protein LOC115999432 n=1 Tax=Ipomoea triloba TaxID=35885 RepID=UPI00125DFBEB|nr:uncharacterized protein LOC115999432 [Ipomoea triloba]